jgi:hypothetical protein
MGMNIILQSSSKAEQCPLRPDGLQVTHLLNFRKRFLKDIVLLGPGVSFLAKDVNGDMKLAACSLIDFLPGFTGERKQWFVSFFSCTSFQRCEDSYDSLCFLRSIRPIKIAVDVIKY